MRSDRQEYLECLGFEATPWQRPGEASSPAPATPTPTEPVAAGAPNAVGARAEGDADSPVAIAGIGLDRPAERELLDRMLTALGWARERVRILVFSHATPDNELFESLASKSRLVLGFYPLKPESFVASRSWLATNSPTECLRDPSLKKKVWGDLQSFARQAKINENFPA